MAAGLGLHVVGFAAQQARFSIVALLIFTWGVLRLAGGRRWGAAALFPLGFMIFAIPLNVLDSLGLGLWLRMKVVDASTWIAHAANIGVLRSGTQLLAPDGSYNYDVAAACSGVRSLTALTALSLLAGYLNFRATWRRALVLLLCFPLVYLGNLARIVAIIFAAEWGGPVWGDRAHEVMGFGIFAIVLGGVLLGVALIRRIWPETPDERSGVRGSVPSAANTVRPMRTGAWPAAIAGTIAVLAGMEVLYLRHLANQPARGAAGVVLAADGIHPAELPTFVGTDWLGRRAEVTGIEREILPADTGFSRKSYVPLTNPAHAVFLSVVLSGRDRTSIHRPELCLVGQGWTITSRTPHRFAYPGEPGAAFPASVLRVEREVKTPRGVRKVPELTAYWFVSADAVVPSHWQMFARDAWQRVAHARADRWAYVLMQTNASDGEAAALQRMQAVLDATLPAFQRRLAVP